MSFWSIRILIFGPQGSGKSYLAGELLDQLFAREPKDILIIARNQEDEPLDRPRVNPINWNEVVDEETTKALYKQKKLSHPNVVKKFINVKGKKYTPIRIDVYSEEVQNSPVESYSNSYLVIDDVERMRTKEATEYAHSIRDSALEVGRKLHIDTVNILHNIKGGVKTSVMRDESVYCFCNPNASGAHKIRAFLSDYCAMDKKEIELFLSIKCRFGCIRTEYPRAIIAKNVVHLL